jgi:hypothetical protein
VESAEDFVAYLLLLSSDAEQSREGRTPWRHDTIPDFLEAIAALIRPSHGGADLVEGLDLPPIHDWRYLAALLHAARSAVVKAELQQVEAIEDSDQVDDADSLRGYIRWLIDDYHADEAELAERAAAGLWASEGRWAHAVMENWLETWAAWLEGWYLDVRTPEIRVERGASLEPVTWASIALQLSAARIYE